MPLGEVGEDDPPLQPVNSVPKAALEATEQAPAQNRRREIGVPRSNLLLILARAHSAARRTEGQDRSHSETGRSFGIGSDWRRLPITDLWRGGVIS